MTDVGPPTLAAHASASTASDADLWLDLSEVVIAPTLIVLVDVDRLGPIDRLTQRALEALGHARSQLVLYSREPSADVVHLRIELPKASWLNPSSFVTPSQMIALMKAGTDSTRTLAIGVDGELRRALDPKTDRVLTLVDEPSRTTYSRRALCATLWAIAKLRYRVRETLSE